MSHGSTRIYSTCKSRNSLLMIICCLRRGACTGNAIEEGEVFTLDKISETAEAIRDKEQSFFLSNVSYEVYWSKVKLVGYTMQLRPEHMRLIAPDIGLDYENDILNYRPTLAKYLLCDEKFGY